MKPPTDCGAKNAAGLSGLFMFALIITRDSGQDHIMGDTLGTAAVYNQWFHPFLMDSN